MTPLKKSDIHMYVYICMYIYCMSMYRYIWYVYIC